MAPDANQMSFNVITNVVFLKLGGVIPMMIVEMVLMKLFVPPILQDPNVDTMNGLADLEISVFQDHFIVMEKLTAKTKVMKLVAVRNRFSLVFLYIDFKNELALSIVCPSLIPFFLQLHQLSL